MGVAGRWLFWGPSNFLKYKRLRKRIKGLKAERRHDRETDSQAVEEFEQELDREVRTISCPCLFAFSWFVGTWRGTQHGFGSGF
mmetsp:Transcript_11798/g.24050  ORF Transcript_11798/g.24050 Transcript_11798/m.24050 type:complete len:84 (-) Transcript_11798:2261-2512(-)